MNNLLSSTQKFIKRNASTILTCIGGAGVITTAVMAAKATPKAMNSLYVAEKEKGEDLTNLEKVQAAGPAYIPSVLMGASTIACIFGANALNKRNQAALISAYAMVNNSYREYREKVNEVYGENADDNVRTEIAKDRYDGKEVLDAGGDELFYDEYSGRYFRSTLYKVQHAEYQLNRDLIMCDAISINAFYHYLGLPELEDGDVLGWSTCMNYEIYWQMWVDFSHSKFTLEDGTECTKIVIFEEPLAGFEEYC